MVVNSVAPTIPAETKDDIFKEIDEGEELPDFEVADE
jgi:hypothetical protein